MKITNTVQTTAESNKKTGTQKNSEPSSSNVAKKAEPPSPSKTSGTSKSNTTAHYEDPAYVVAVSKREKTPEEMQQSKGYSPQEVKAKARTLLESGILPPEQSSVLSEILNKDNPIDKS